MSAESYKKEQRMIESLQNDLEHTLKSRNFSHCWANWTERKQQNREKEKYNKRKYLNAKKKAYIEENKRIERLENINGSLSYKSSALEKVYSIMK